LAALLLGSHEDCSHYALSVDAMDSNRLGEALSPTDWATRSVLCCRSASMLIRLEEIGGSFLLSITSKWRVQDGDCPSINQVSAVVQAWSSVDDVQIVHYPCVAWIGRLVMKCGCFVMVDWRREPFRRSVGKMGLLVQLVHARLQSLVRYACHCCRLESI
jgi:hypothetical protein